jgi:AAA family ATP:ADP antiporter
VATGHCHEHGMKGAPLPPGPPRTIPRSGVRRLLAAHTDVRKGEAVPALLMALSAFTLLAAYYVIKPVRDALVVRLDSGAEYKSYLGGGVAAGLLVAVPLYARFSDRLPKDQLVYRVTLFFAAHLVVFFAATTVRSFESYLGLVFYLWVGVFSVMVVAQFWAFAADLYSEEQGERLFPLLGLGQALGAMVGSGVAVTLSRTVGTYPMLLVGSLLLISSALLGALAHARFQRTPFEVTAAARASSAAPTEGAFALTLSNRYLLLIAVFSLVFTTVNTNGEFILAKLLKSAATSAVESGAITRAEVTDYLSASYGRFQLGVNAATLLLQGFVVSRLLKVAGFARTFLVFPLVALAGAMFTTAMPVLWVVLVGKTLEDATDYSVNNTTRNLLWMRTTTAMKYKAKQAVDSFFVRLGDVTSALLVAIGAAALGAGVRAFALINVVLVAVWLWIARAMLRERESRRLLAAETAADPTASPPEAERIT